MDKGDLLTTLRDFRRRIKNQLRQPEQHYNHLTAILTPRKPPALKDTTPTKGKIYFANKYKNFKARARLQQEIVKKFSSLSSVANPPNKSPHPRQPTPTRSAIAFPGFKQWKSEYKLWVHLVYRRRTRVCTSRTGF